MPRTLAVSSTGGKGTVDPDGTRVSIGTGVGVVVACAGDSTTVR